VLDEVGELAIWLTTKYATHASNTAKAIPIPIHGVRRGAVGTFGTGAVISRRGMRGFGVSPDRAPYSTAPTSSS